MRHLKKISLSIFWCIFLFILVGFGFCYDSIDIKYTVICKTDNQQLWTICFDGIDQNNRYLLNKKIEVKVEVE